MNLLEHLIMIAGIALSGPATTMGDVALSVGQQEPAKEVETCLLQEACEGLLDWTCAPTHKARRDP